MVPSELIHEMVAFQGPGLFEICLEDWEPEDEIDIRRLVEVLNMLTPTPKLKLVERDEQ